MASILSRPQYVNILIHGSTVGYSLIKYGCDLWYFSLETKRYSNVIMSAMASQITCILICLLNHLLKCRSKKTLKHCVTGLFAENSPVAHEFPTQRPVMRKMFPFDDLIMRRKVLKNGPAVLNIKLCEYKIQFAIWPVSYESLGCCSLNLMCCWHNK